MILTKKIDIIGLQPSPMEDAVMEKDLFDKDNGLGLSE
jgi:hypothetical protein